MTELEIKNYMTEKLRKVVNIPSPSGYTKEVMGWLKAEAENLGFHTEYTSRGALIVDVHEGDVKDGGNRLLAAHCDTLGAMVRTIVDDGTLKLVPVGGYMMESIEGEYCTVHTRDGRSYTGTILTTEPSVHVFPECRDQKRTDDCMRVRLDEDVHTKEEVRALGIENGDYISFDPRFVACESGYIKSRHLDDKASTAVLLTLLKEIHDGKVNPVGKIRMLFTNFEEVGFGASYIPEDVTEMLAVDMGAVGDDLEGDEKKVCIVAKDSAGPYDYDLTTKMIEMAKELGLDYAVDCYRRYSSDASAAIRGGHNVRHALIGQGVQASHHMERTHIHGMMQTLKLVEAYVQRNTQVGIF